MLERWGSLGAELLVVGELDGAVAHLEEAAQLAELLDDRRVLAEARVNLAWVAIVRGDYEEARRLGERLLARVQDMPAQLAFTLCLLGWSLHHLGDPAAADRFRESLAIVRSLSSKQVAECLTGLSATEVAAGRNDPAARLAGLAEGVCAAHGIELEPFVRSVMERTNTTARAALGDTEYERLYERGRHCRPRRQFTTSSPDGSTADSYTRFVRTYGGDQVSTWSVLRLSCESKYPVGLVKQPGTT